MIPARHTSCRGDVVCPVELVVLRGAAGVSAIASQAQLFLVAGRSATNSPDPGIVALAWDPSPDPRATGYFLCWGLDSSDCTTSWMLAT